MKVYILFSTYLNSDCEPIETLQKIFSTKHKADEYLQRILEKHKQRYLEQAEELKTRLDNPKDFTFRYYQNREAVEQNIIFLQDKAKNLNITDLDYIIKEYEVD